MSQENVEIVREIFARLRRSESVLDVLSPAVVWEARMGPEEGQHHGVEAVADYYRRYFGTWENFRVEIEEVRQLPDGRVFVAARDSGRGKQSGVEVEMLVFQIWTLEEGKVVRWQGFPSREQALEAAGLQD
jgi:ketosteroid isomerase-like protein